MNTKFVRSFEDLDVYKKAYSSALYIHKASLDLPKIEQYALADQMRRASKSICANIAEGFAKQRVSLPEFKRFLAMAIGSSDEMKVWLDFCKDLGYFDGDKVKKLKSEYTDVAKMLTGLANKWS
jgi:four helix bundle protein